MLLSVCLNDQPLLSNSTRTTPFPYVNYFGDSDVFGPLTTFKVYADATEVTSCRDVVTAVTCCFLMYWIFDIKYAKPYYRTLAFLDNYVFKKNSVSLPQKVISLINKLVLLILSLLFVDTAVH